MKKPQFIIAAPTSNAGKTTVTLGLLRALKNRGLSPQPFKCGPDYIDPKFHEVACEKVGVNLDTFLMGETHVREIYAKYAQSCEAVCIEGVMGLFDGAKKSEGSTAELAKLLGLPIIFVVDAKSVAYSVAPLLFGFKNFDPTLNIAGVIFNRVNTDSHYQFLKEACEDVGITPLGRVPNLPDCEIPSRHLGLSIDKMSGYQSVIERVSRAIEETVDIDDLLKTCLSDIPEYIPAVSLATKNCTIAIAKDEAFNFSYIENIEALKRRGEVMYFSPLKDVEVPQVDIVYLPGGYPEYHLAALSANTSMLNSLKDHLTAGGQVIAECGGMMYLGNVIKDKMGQTFEMAKILDLSTSMESMKLRLGYRSLSHEGVLLKGHEFHYSTVCDYDMLSSLGTITNAREQTVDTKIFKYKNVLASYIHFYFGTDELLEQLLEL